MTHSSPALPAVRRNSLGTVCLEAKRTDRRGGTFSREHPMNKYCILVFGLVLAIGAIFEAIFAAHKNLKEPEWAKLAWWLGTAIIAAGSMWND